MVSNWSAKSSLQRLRQGFPGSSIQITALALCCGLHPGRCINILIRSTRFYIALQDGWCPYISGLGFGAKRWQGACLLRDN
ncbi:hypothetical protein TNCT_418791 [Trichonephila clavata]|uniref:Uncharacterized protein n=1 Tax=Trichonephila clavata TaxID=2740835 RepID=A0A8X6L420_TRICU|nr:hypothetical protein TNCT_418791 [Trichonephila clavata]